MSDATPQLSSDSPVQGGDDVSEAVLTPVAADESARVPTEQFTEARHQTGSAVADPAPTPQPSSALIARRVRATRNSASQRLSQSGGSNAQSGLRFDPSLRDELAELERENFRLKALLRSRLEAENVQLNLMLARLHWRSDNENPWSEGQTAV